MNKSPQNLKSVLKEHCKKWYAAQVALNEAEESTWRAACECEGYDGEDWNELLLEGWEFDRYDSESHCFSAVFLQIKKSFLEIEKAGIEDQIKLLESE